MDFEAVSAKSQVISESRGSVICGPNSADISDRLARKQAGEKVKVTFDEISKNSVTFPSGSVHRKKLWSDSEFEKVEDVDLLYVYRGEYDSVYGIWKSKIDQITGI
jgi:hypothetical protein